ncbi:hypothetical protein SMIF22_11920 [Streptococcus mitis]
MKLTKSAQNTVLRLQIELTKSVSHTYGKATLTKFEEYKEFRLLTKVILFSRIEDAMSR